MLIWPVFLFAGIILMLCFKLSRIRYIFAAILIILSLYILHLAQHGITFSKTTSPNGKQRAWVHHQGMSIFSICIDRGKGKELIPHQSSMGTPAIKKLVWISDTLLGVDQSGSYEFGGMVDFVVDTEVYFSAKDMLKNLPEKLNMEEYELRSKLENDIYKNQIWKREPLDSELKYFNNN